MLVTMRRTVVCGILGAAAILAGLTTTALAQAEYKLTFADFGANRGPRAEVLNWWADELNKRTDGRVEVDFAWSGALLKTQDILHGVRGGVADMGTVIATATPAEFPLYSFGSFPLNEVDSWVGVNAWWELHKTSEHLQAELEMIGAGREHQDQQAGWGTYADFFITALVSIDEATVENGCLEVAAGWHDKGLVGDEWTPLGEGETADMVFEPYPTQPGDAMFFDSYAPHRSGPNLTESARRVLYVTYNRASEGDHRAAYFADKRKSFPPDIERDPDKTYVFRV